MIVIIYTVPLSISSTDFKALCFVVDSGRYSSMYTMYVQTILKGIVSQYWGGLQMILLDRLEVFIISATHFFLFCCRFRTVNLKMAA